jgi:hypothetical protein
MPHETELCHARACLTTEKLKKMNAEKFVFRGGLALSLPSGNHASNLAANFEILLHHHLGQHISPIIIGVNFLKMHFLRIQHISNPMITHINML